jgi:DNA polymerase-3 subunit alpha
MEPILKETHGVILYQEQVQALAANMAGFSLSEGDTLRRAMGKKIPEVMAQYRDQFVEGAASQGIKRQIAEQVFQEIEYFAGYGFNKSHSACYALLAYQTAWLKAVYPVQFMAAVLTLDSGNTDKVVEYINECGRLNIEVLPPDVNASESRFTVDDGKIRFGLSAVKGVGQKAVEVIVAARGSGGVFRDVFDFCEQVDTRACNRAVIEALIKAGAFDSTGARRAQNAAVLDAALSSGSRLARDRAQGQMTLMDAGGFVDDEGEHRPVMPEIPEWPENKLLEFEKAVLGFYLTSHPLARHADEIRKFSSVSSTGLSSIPEGAEVLVGGLLATVKTTTTKKDGRRMARVVLEDLDGTVEAVAFPRTFDRYAEEIRADNIVFLRGKAERKMERPSIIIDEIIPLERARWELAGSAVLRFASDELSDELLEALEEVLAAHKGRKPVYFQVRTEEGETVTVQAGSGGISPSDRLHEDLCDLVGDKRIEFLPEGRR